MRLKEKVQPVRKVHLLFPVKLTTCVHVCGFLFRGELDWHQSESRTNLTAAWQQPHRGYILKNRTCDVFYTVDIVIELLLAKESPYDDKKARLDGAWKGTHPFVVVPRYKPVPTCFLQLQLPTWTDFVLPLIKQCLPLCRCCCLGIAPRAKMLKMSAWLLHPKWWQGSNCHTRQWRGCMFVKAMLLSSQRKRQLQLVFEQ